MVLNLSGHSMATQKNFFFPFTDAPFESGLLQVGHFNRILDIPFKK